MTCMRAPKAHDLSVISLLITIFAILIALVAPAQLAGGGQPSAKPTVATTRRAASPPLFLPAVAYDSGGLIADSVTVADVNGDGKPDLLVANQAQGPLNHGLVGVLLGNGDGTFQAVVTYDSGDDNAIAVAVADVNGDGKRDLMVANLGTVAGGTVGVLLGNGDGTFQGVVSYPSGGNDASSVAVADVNSDGKPDLVVTNCSPGCQTMGVVGVLLGNGNGTFQTALTFDSGGSGAVSVAVADVNGDGKPDLLVTNQCVSSSDCTNGTVGVLLGNGDGTFQPAVTYGSGGSGNAFDGSVAVADLNGDDKPDLLVANPVSNLVGVLLGNGNGTFQTAVTFDSGGSGAVSAAVADVNGDGKPDLLVTNQCVSSSNCTNGTVGVLLGNGDGTFQPAVTYGSGGSLPHSVAVADVNGDGKPDILMANTGSDTVSVLLNNTQADTTPPVITLFATPKILWPPNSKMVPITVSGTITDTGSGVNANSAAYAVKDEYGEVQPKGPIPLGPGGNYSFTVLLQASRLGTDMDGRRYTVTVRAKDNAGNGGSKTSVVIVPHD